ncbi:MAG TPA: nickel pincer cofactor biosynthesis protein LarB [Elusimicrobia bacterium]|jgi:hypothetical protein|nr:nickel pincer cofactor biosynthesis protein LarB [Elusimicrobiota bacterium]
MKKIRVDANRKQSSKFVYEDLEFAKLDLSREGRQNFPEAVYCPGKTAEQIIKIVAKLRKENRLVILTRAEPKVYRAVKRNFKQAKYYQLAKIITVSQKPSAIGQWPRGFIAVVTAGTSDIPVAEEAAVTAEILGNKTIRIYDIGVAGIHRLFAHKEKILNASVVIVCAGMEGALPSIIGGLVSSPVIGVPTSVGYGGNFQGLTALFTMLNSCAANVCCVNIDDGFGAGIIAHLINKKMIQTDKKADSDRF